MRVTKFTQSNKKVLASDNSDKIKLHCTASYLAERMLWSRLTIIEALDWRLESTVTSSAAVQLILAALSEREGHENNARMGDAKAHFIMEPCIVRGKQSPLSKDTYRATPTDLGLEIHNFLSLITGLPNKACTWFGELCSCPCLVSRNKLHQTTCKPYSGAL